ncbi:META domain-containing protein [Dysgonomonas sp. 216]|uniref:META domain-containing protein n=1 Tax=Dysgonomonas sp. 216 TaxID=2302934 RepID=UPI0013CF5902|nr:META domain-containing protein [Dysgonomonas sp. 216]NDW18218.1 META domain-containing protein [Dysgonomonas sp. 216]
MKKILFIVFVILIGLQGCQQSSKTVDPSQIEGFWVLKSIDGNDAKIVFTGALPTVLFDFKEMNISGTGGCNSYSGVFTLDKNIISAPNIVSTRMLCFGDIPEQDFFERIKSGIVSVEDSVLAITNIENEAVSLIFEKGKSPVAKKGPVSVEQLAGNWMLKTMEGVQASAIFSSSEPKIPTLMIEPSDSIIGGNAGCNRYGSKFRVSDNLLIVEPVFATQMACPDMEGEYKYLKNIADTSELSMPDNNTLLLMKKGAAVLEFEKVN